jgi:hydrogenase expression/formation protein HypC
MTMCLAIPGRVVELATRNGLPVALVDFDGTTMEIALAFVPDVQVGDFVIAHAGVAIQRLDEAAAAETLRLFDEMGEGSAGRS